MGENKPKRENSRKTGLRSLLLTSDYPPISGGIATFLHNLWATSNMKESMVLAPASKGWKEFDRNSPNRIVRFPCVKSQSIITKIINFFSLGIYTLFYLTIHSVEHLHCGQLIRTGIFGYLRKLITGKGYYLWVYGGETKPDFFKNKFIASLNKKILRSAEFIFTISPFTSQEFSDYGLKILEILPAVDIKTFYPQEKNKVLIEQYKLQNKKVLFTCGRLVERKGHDKVLEALPEVIKKIPNIVYIIVGEGPYKSNLESIIMKQGLQEYVHFAGTVDAELLPDYYNLCDLFIMPNRAVGSVGTKTYSVEGFGIVFLEAAACGKPVIGGDSGGAVCAVDRDINGFLVPPENTEQIADKIITLFKDDSLYKKFSRNGLEHTKKFTWEQSAKKLRTYL